MLLAMRRSAGRWSSETAMTGGRIGWHPSGNRVPVPEVHRAKAGSGLMIETVTRKETMRVEDSKPSIHRSLLVTSKIAPATAGARS